MSRADQPTTTGTPRRYEPPTAIRTDWLTTLPARRPDRNLVPPSRTSPDHGASEPSLAPAEGVKADREVSRPSDVAVATASWTQPRRMRRSVVATLAFLGGGLTLSAVDRAWLRDSATPAPAVPV